MNAQDTFNNLVRNYKEENKGTTGDTLATLWCRTRNTEYNQIIVNACFTLSKETVFSTLIALGTNEWFLNNMIAPKLIQE